MCLGGAYMFATFVWCSHALSIVKSMTSGATKVILLVVSIGLNQFSSAGIVSDSRCSFCRTEVAAERAFRNPEKLGSCSGNNARLFKVLMVTRHPSCEWTSIPSDGRCPRLLCFCLSITVYFERTSIPYGDRQVIHLKT
jgi:hypothetical protein